MSEDADWSLLDLAAELIERVVAELGVRGEKAVSALRTATEFITQDVRDQTGLRLAESAAYNLREAPEAVVAGRDPVPGGLPKVVEAWEQAKREMAEPGTDLARL